VVDSISHTAAPESERCWPAAGEREISFPDPIAKYILYLKHLYPPIHYREIVRIIGKKFGYQTDHHKVNLRTIQTTR